MTQDQRKGVEGFLDDIKEARLDRRQLLATAAALGFAGSLSGLLSACSGDDSTGGTGTATSGGATGEATRGGTMRIGLPFGAASTNDPHPAPPGQQDTIRNFNVFNLLYWYDPEGNLYPMLAESAEPNADATVWTIRLKSGVQFHDGSPLTADDVIFSFQRILDKKTGAEASGALAMVNAKGMKKIDNLTVQVPMNYAFSILPNQLATKGTSIVKAGTTNFDNPIGTGAFKFVSGDGQKVVLERNENYWVEGYPYLDTAELVNVQDPTARLNGVKAGELQAIYPVDSSQAAAVGSDTSVKLFTSKTATFMPLLMNAGVAPFSDANAREALKLACDRDAMNRVAYGGEGNLGNDMFGYIDPGYPSDVAQREFDPEKAAGLWKDAGLEGTKLELWVADIWPGQVTSSTAYAQQAKQAGIDIEIKKTSADQYFTKAYGVQPFTNEYWNYRPIITLWSECFNADSPYYSTTNWATPESTKLYSQAIGETDEDKRNEMTGEMMRIFHDDGPYVVWAFEATTDIYASNVGGQENNAIRGLNGFALDKFYLQG